MAEDLIGPLTAAEWCSFRLGDDDEDQDLIKCCGVTSNFRDEVMHLLRMGATNLDPGGIGGFRGAYWNLVAHGLPDGPGAELIARLAVYYLGDPPAPREERDDWTTGDFLDAIRRRQDQRDTGALHTKQQISGYAINTMPDDYAAQHMWQVNAERHHGDQWMVTRNGRVADRNGTWRRQSPAGIEPEGHLMPRQEAIELAHQLAPKVVDYFGATAAEHLERLMEARRG